MSPKFALTHRRSENTIRYVIMAVAAFAFFFPLFFLISGSFMSVADVTSYPPKIFPPGFHLHFENYKQALDFLSVRIIINSFIFTMGILILQLVLSLCAGFALAKIPFKYATFVVALFAVPMFLPTNVSIIPLFIVTFKLGLLNTWAGMILPIVGSTAFGTLLFRQFFVNFPTSLIEAAKIDGASWPRVLWKIVIPLSKPPMASYAAVTFLTAWNMYVWPLLIGTKQSLRVLTVQLAPLVMGGSSFYAHTPPNIVYAASVISCIPVLAVFILAQKWFINAISGTGQD